MGIDTIIFGWICNWFKISYVIHAVTGTSSSFFVSGLKWELPQEFSTSVCCHSLNHYHFNDSNSCAAVLVQRKNAKSSLAVHCASQNQSARRSHLIMLLILTEIQLMNKQCIFEHAIIGNANQLDYTNFEVGLCISCNSTLWYTKIINLWYTKQERLWSRASCAKVQ